MVKKERDPDGLVATFMRYLGKNPGAKGVKKAKTITGQIETGLNSLSTAKADMKAQIKDNVVIIESKEAEIKQLQADIIMITALEKNIKSILTLPVKQ